MNPTSDELQKLQNKARDSLRALSRCRPLFVEFAGTPKSGKSTCIDTVEHFFRRLDFKVLAPTEGASKRTPYFLKDDLVSFNIWSAAYALTHILEGRYGSDEYHLVIMDRGLFDALAWFELLRLKEDIAEQDCAAIQKFLLIERWRNLVDIIFLFNTDPETSLERENQNKLIEEPGRAMNSEFLTELNLAYDKTRKNYADKFNRFEIIDTGHGSSTSQQLAAYKIAEMIVEELA